MIGINLAKAWLLSTAFCHGCYMWRKRHVIVQDAIALAFESFTWNYFLTACNPLLDIQLSTTLIVAFPLDVIISSCFAVMTNIRSSANPKAFCTFWYVESQVRHHTLYSRGDEPTLTPWVTSLVICTLSMPC